jgi:hypothetical protein
MSSVRILAGSINRPSNAASRVTALLAKIQTGKIIYAADINAIDALVSEWSNHTHVYTDTYGIHNFGNTNAAGYAGGAGSSESKTTDKPYGAANYTASTRSGKILASHQSSMAAEVSALSSHYHYIDDRQS